MTTDQHERIEMEPSKTKTFTLTITEKDLGTLSTALGKLPFSEVAPLFASFQQQVANQTRPQPEKPKQPEKKKKEKTDQPVS